MTMKYDVKPWGRIQELRTRYADALYAWGSETLLDGDKPVAVFGLAIEFANSDYYYLIDDHCFRSEEDAMEFADELNAAEGISSAVADQIRHSSLEEDEHLLSV